ncbi:hypothetical protein [Aquabacterium humicola]|uniref:hypothetical protein n=1 Tax=Aquabacterium humicola TaxID=3237377 RepID=UPI002543AEC4|nr:hypothetical protein [Rubrivivax pictus]
MAHDNHVSQRDAPPASVDRAEERAWIGFYERVGRHPALAIEIMAVLDPDPDSKRRHLALYLLCKQSVRCHKAREARDRRIGELVRLVLRALILRPLRATRTAAARAADLIAAFAPVRKTHGRPDGRSASKPAEPATGPACPSVRQLVRGAPQEEGEGLSDLPARGSDPVRNAMADPTPAVTLRR